MWTRSRRQGGGGIPRRRFLHSVVAAPFFTPLSRIPLATGQGRDALPVRVSTLNHVSFGCVDLPATVAWYERVLGVPRHAFQDYAGGQTVLRVGTDPSAYMALTERDPESPGGSATRRPHFCWGVPDFNVHRILAALAEMRAPARSVLREGTTINGVNFDGPDGAPLQFNPEIACGGLGFLGEVCDTSAAAVRRPADPPPIQVRTLNHIKYVVTDLERALEWYQRLTDMRVRHPSGAGAGDTHRRLRRPADPGAPGWRGTSTSGLGRGVRPRRVPAARRPRRGRVRSGPGDGRARAT